MNNILAYGTLRKGDYNFDRMQSHFGEESIKKVGETTLKGYRMHDLGFYPGINASSEDEIVCDILEVNDEAYRSIDRMELGAGYSNHKVDIDGKSYTIYVHNSDLSHLPKIKEGDWMKNR